MSIIMSICSTFVFAWRHFAIESGSCQYK